MTIQLISIQKKKKTKLLLKSFLWEKNYVNFTRRDIIYIKADAKVIAVKPKKQN